MELQDLMATAFLSPHGKTITLTIPYKDKQAVLPMVGQEAEALAARLEALGTHLPQEDPENAWRDEEAFWRFLRVEGTARGMCLFTELAPSTMDTSKCVIYLGLSGTHNLSNAIRQRLRAPGAQGKLRRRRRPAHGAG